ncbi:sulfotransferase family protein [Thiohalorhabdus sp.]|uniref:sulfotransferase family protein n=1 Tax=Thiohalorhabdus sp. TaxID=3094134 RepID=UPI002FC2D009
MLDREEKWWLRWHPLARGIDPRVRVEWVTRRAAINPARRYCYFRLPKCANSTVIKTLFRYDPTLEEGPVSADVHTMKKRFSGLFRARVWTPRQLTANYFCFSVVRNPYTRVLSAYLDKIAAAEAGQYGFVARSAGFEEARGVSFSRFVSFLESGGLYANPHWAPQVALLPVEPSGLAFLGRVESLDEDLGKLADRLFGEGTFQGAALRADRRRGSDIRTADFYDAELFCRVYRLYRSDFEAFGYSGHPE